VIGQLAAHASIDRKVVSTTNGRLMPSTPSRYSMLNGLIQGSFTTPCMPGSPRVNCAGSTDEPKSPGMAIQSESRNTTAVVASAIQRIASSRAFGMIGSERKNATNAGRKTSVESGQRAGCSTGGMVGLLGSAGSVKG